MGQQFMPIKSKAGPSLIRLVQVHTFISSHDELGILGGICQTGAAQGTPMCIQFYFGVFFDGQRVALGRR